MARLKRLIGHRMCLEGNLESVGVLAAGTPSQIEEAVRAIIMGAGAGGGLIISTGGGISTGTPPENIEIMIAATQRFGRYPLPFETNLAQAPPAVPRRATAVREAASLSADPLAQLFDLVANGKVEDVVEVVGKLLETGLVPRLLKNPLMGQSRGICSGEACLATT